jgi:hypothetical protein
MFLGVIMITITVRIGTVWALVLISVLLCQCRKVGENPTLEPWIDEQEQPAIQVIDREVVDFLVDYVDELVEEKTFLGSLVRGPQDPGPIQKAGRGSYFPTAN